MKRTGFAVLMLLVLTAGAAMAKDHGRGHDRDRGWDRDRHDHYRYVDHRPPGWDHGKKTGWHGRSLPPGQAKKYYRHRDHRYDRRDRRPIIINRPAPTRPVIINRPSGSPVVIDRPSTRPRPSGPPVVLPSGRRFPS